MLPDRPRKILYLCDLHAPYHHQASLDEVRGRAVEWAPDLIVFGGDMLDFHGLSAYTRDPSAPDLQEEIDTCAMLLRPFTAIAPTVYLWGNHEIRLTRWLFQTPAAARLRLLDLRTLLADAGLHVDAVAHQWAVGEHLLMIHGTMYGVTAARTVALRCPGKTVVQGHSHYISSYTVENFGVVGRCYTAGWLGDQDLMDYDRGRFSQWCRGWVEITGEMEGKWWSVSQRVCQTVGD